MHNSDHAPRRAKSDNARLPEIWLPRIEKGAEDSGYSSPQAWLRNSLTNAMHSWTPLRPGEAEAVRNARGSLGLSLPFHTGLAQCPTWPIVLPGSLNFTDYARHGIRRTLVGSNKAGPERPILPPHRPSLMDARVVRARWGTNP